MEEWYCFKCKEKLVEKDLNASYMDISQTIRGLQCPQCKTAYLTEKTTVEIVNYGEEEIEAKL